MIQALTFSVYCGLFMILWWLSWGTFCVCHPCLQSSSSRIWHCTPFLESASADISQKAVDLLLPVLFLSLFSKKNWQLEHAHLYLLMFKFFLITSNCPSPSLFDMAIVAAFVFFINSALPKCISLDMVIMKGISFMYMTSVSSAMVRSFFYYIQWAPVSVVLFCPLGIPHLSQTRLLHAICLLS